MVKATKDHRSNDRDVGGPIVGASACVCVCLCVGGRLNTSDLPF